MTVPERCQECGFVFGTVVPGSAPVLLRRVGPAYTEALLSSATDPRLRRRPSPGMWSPLEYAAHLRDVLQLFGRRVEAILERDHPRLEVADHPRMVAEGGYNRLAPSALGAEITEAAAALAGVLERLPAAEWGRSGTRDDEERSILEVAQRALHEAHHHLLDFARGMEAGTGEVS